jgi:hypothetical protein
VPPKQTVALDANANAIAATTRLFTNLYNKFLLIVSFPFKGTLWLYTLAIYSPEERLSIT